MATSANNLAPMDTQPRIPEMQFRVLIIGRANAGKTSILQRVCNTTNSTIINGGNEEVTLDREHNIDDGLVFSNMTGYVFHDSLGLKAGHVDKIEIVREFILRKCGETRVQDKLHAIWYCVPLDGPRQALHQNICPDPKVAVIVVFTKHDRFMYNVEQDILDHPEAYPDKDVSKEAEQRFQEDYLRPLGDGAIYVRLGKMHLQDSRCDELIEKTAAALNEDFVKSMFSHLVPTS